MHVRSRIPRSSADPFDPEHMTSGNLGTFDLPGCVCALDPVFSQISLQRKSPKQARNCDAAADQRPPKIEARHRDEQNYGSHHEHHRPKPHPRHR
jgi:hypothetical protein